MISINPQTTTAESAMLKVGHLCKPKIPKNFTSIKSTTPSALTNLSIRFPIPPPTIPAIAHLCNFENSLFLK